MKRYIIQGTGIVVYYLYGRLIKVEVLGDKIEWDAIKHDIPFHEDEILTLKQKHDERAFS